MILVTGGTGLVGSHLLWHLLQRGEKVRAIHRPGSDLEQVREVFGYYDHPSENETRGASHYPAAETARHETVHRQAGPVTGSTVGKYASSDSAGSTVGKYASSDSTGSTGGKYASSAGAGGLFSRIEWVAADMLDPFQLDEAFRGITKVYHCAAIVSFDPSERKKLIKNNIESTANVVNLCLDHKVEKLCHVSSVSALGTRYDEEPVTEQDMWKPSKRRHAYSISKYHSEMEVWRGIEEGLNAVIVNPSVILGPGNWKRGSAAFFTRMQKGMKYYTTGMTGFVDVRDVCRCMTGLMESDISGERFIINSENLYFRDLFNMIADALGKHRPSRHASKTLVEAGWRLEWLRSRLTFSKPLLTRETARSGRGISRYSNEKIRQALACVFFPVRETIAWTARELLNNE